MDRADRRTRRDNGTEMARKFFPLSLERAYLAGQLDLANLWEVQEGVQARAADEAVWARAVEEVVLAPTGAMICPHCKREVNDPECTCVVLPVTGEVFTGTYKPISFDVTDEEDVANWTGWSQDPYEGEQYRDAGVVRADGKCVRCGKPVPNPPPGGNLFHCSDECMADSRWLNSPRNPANWPSGVDPEEDDW